MVHVVFGVAWCFGVSIESCCHDTNPYRGVIISHPIHIAARLEKSAHRRFLRMQSGSNNFKEIAANYSMQESRDRRCAWVNVGCK
jgi:hypothetical protein